MLLLLQVLALFLLACSRNEDDPEIDKGCYIDISNLDFTFGIDYNDTSKYLLPGEQSDLDDFYLEEIQGAIGQAENSIPYILKLCNWINQNFTFENAGGGMIGIPTVDELYESRTFYGCHSQALLISSRYD